MRLAVIVAVILIARPALADGPGAPDSATSTTRSADVSAKLAELRESATRTWNAWIAEWRAAGNRPVALRAAIETWQLDREKAKGQWIHIPRLDASHVRMIDESHGIVTIDGAEIAVPVGADRAAGIANDAWKAIEAGMPHGFRAQDLGDERETFECIARIVGDETFHASDGAPWSTVPLVWIFARRERYVAVIPGRGCSVEDVKWAAADRLDARALRKGVFEQGRTAPPREGER